jgi:hypothetical protein
MAAALPAGFANVRHAASNRPPTSIPLLRNPRAPPYKARRAGLSLYRATIGDFPHKIRCRPCLEAPLGFSFMLRRNPEEEGKMGGVEKVDRRAQAP